MSKVELKKQQIIQAIAQYFIVNGLTDMGLRKLARVGGTSDRMLIYYFETKDALVGEVLHLISANMASQLDGALGTHQRSYDELFADLLALTNSEEFLLGVKLWFEVVGLTVRGQEPYATYALTIANSWITWIEGRLLNPQPGQATTLFATIEGHLLVKLVGIELPS